MSEFRTGEAFAATEPASYGIVRVELMIAAGDSVTTCTQIGILRPGGGERGVRLYIRHEPTAAAVPIVAIACCVTMRRCTRRCGFA